MALALIRKAIEAIKTGVFVTAIAAMPGTRGVWWPGFIRSQVQFPCSRKLAIGIVSVASAWSFAMNPLVAWVKVQFKERL